MVQQHRRLLRCQVALVAVTACLLHRSGHTGCYSSHRIRRTPAVFAFLALLPHLQPLEQGAVIAMVPRPVADDSGGQLDWVAHQVRLVSDVQYRCSMHEVNRVQYRCRTDKVSSRPHNLVPLVMSTGG
jgi:hypothetical protein